MYKLMQQIQNVQNEKPPIEPDCWHCLDPTIQYLLIEAISANYRNRKSAQEMFLMFCQVDVGNGEHANEVTEKEWFLDKCQSVDYLIEQIYLKIKTVLIADKKYIASEQGQNSLKFLVQDGEINN